MDAMKIREVREYQTAIKSVNAFKKDANAISPRKLNIKRTILTSQKEIDQELQGIKGTIGDPLKTISAMGSTKGKSAHKLTKNNQKLAGGDRNTNNVTGNGPEKKLQFPLLTNDDDLDNLLNQMMKDYAIDPLVIPSDDNLSDS